MHKTVKYGLVILRDKKFLINRKHNTKLFLMPGGKPNPQESVKDCLAREMMEEHKVGLIADSVKHFGDFEDKAANEPDTIISIRLYIGEVKGEPTTNSEIEELRWFGKGDDPRILAPSIKNKILPYLIKHKLIR
jgi:8-oxo-dGTP diphosphatase